MKNIIMSILVLILASAVSAHAAVMPRISGIYSNLTYNEAGGDLLGMELLIFPSSDNTSQSNFTALVQIAKGGPPFAVLVPLKVDKNRIEFTIPADGKHKPEHFTGKFRGSDLIVFQRHGKEEILKRGRSYWE